MPTADARLAGKRILVAEDDYLIAKCLARELHAAGVEVLGPVPTIDQALQFAGAGQIDGAVLDIDLRGEMAYAVVDFLLECGVPFLLGTGHTLDALPMRYRHVPYCTKPVEVGALARTLFPS